MAVCSLSCLFSFVFLIVCLQMEGLPAFVPLLILGFVCLFSINAVVRAAIMWSVPLALRSMACSLDTVMIHVFGDIPSPPIVGAIEDSLVEERGADRGNWRVALSAGVAPLLGAAITFGAAALLAHAKESKGAPVASADDGEELRLSDESDERAPSVVSVSSVVGSRRAAQEAAARNGQVVTAMAAAAAIDHHGGTGPARAPEEAAGGARHFV